MNPAPNLPPLCLSSPGVFILSKILMPARQTLVFHKYDCTKDDISYEAKATNTHAPNIKDKNMFTLVNAFQMVLSDEFM